jgi:hypothetical protein
MIPMEGAQAPSRWGWLEVAVSLLLMGPALVIGSVLAFAGGYIAARGEPNPLHIAIPAQALAYLLWLTSLWALFRFKDLNMWSELAWVWKWKDVLRWLAAGPAIALAVGFLAALLRAPRVEMELMRELLGDPRALPLFVLFGVTLAPFVEELIFRGVMLPVAARTMGAAGALLLTSLPFSLIHGPQYSWSWQHLLLLVVVGIVFGLIRLRTGSTVATTSAHAAYNLTMFAGYLVQQRNQ